MAKSKTKTIPSKKKKTTTGNSKNKTTSGTSKLLGSSMDNPVSPKLDVAGIMSGDIQLTKEQNDYLELRIDMCLKSYDKFTRDEAKEWLLKNNHITKAVKFA